MSAELPKMPDPLVLKPCPFCGAPASGYAIEPHTHHVVFNGVRMPDHPGSYVIEGDCQCGSGLIGDTQEEVTARWNTRHSPYTAADLEQAKQQAARQAMEQRPSEPPPGLLMSMAIRYDHGLGVPGYYDSPIYKSMVGVSHQRRLESTLGVMRQLWEEVAGKGFYSPEKEDEYRALIPQSEQRHG